MSKIIHVSDDLYHRIEAHASRFDTPADVIKRVLDAYENASDKPADRDDPVVPRSLATDSSAAADISEQDTNIQPATRLDIIYVSGSKRVSEEEFKQELLKNKRAYRRLYYTNGKTKDKPWNAPNFGRKSGVSNNLRSSNCLRKWRQEGIYKAVVSVNRADLATDYH